MNEEFFQHSNRNVVPEKGDFLISEPFLPDNNFSRSVVLLCEHNEEGSFGFVLNRTSNLRLSDLLQEVHSKVDFEVFVGGPVQQNTLHFIHQMPNYLENSIEIKNGVYWGGNFEQLKILLENDNVNSKEIKFFVGYSGWGEGQLVDELKVNSWIVSKNTDVGQVFNTKSDALWKEALEKMGGKYKMFSKYPENPRLN